MKIVALILSLFGHSWVLANGPSCQTFESSKEGFYLQYVEVGLAIVTAEAISESYLSGEESVTQFRVMRKWKDQIGLDLSNNITVYTRYPKTLKYEKGQQYLLYLTDSGRLFTTNICMGTRNVKDVSELRWKYLNEIPHPMFE